MASLSEVRLEIVKLTFRGGDPKLAVETARVLEGYVLEVPDKVPTPGQDTLHVPKKDVRETGKYPVR